MAYKGVWCGCWEDHSWGSPMAGHMHDMGVNHVLRAYELKGDPDNSREKAIYNWIKDHPDETFQFVPHFHYSPYPEIDPAKIMRDWVEAPSPPWTEDQVKARVNQLLDFFSPFSPVSGYVIYEENYILGWYEGSPYFNTVIETVHGRSGFGDKDLIVVGNMDEQYIPAWVRNKTWSYYQGLMMHESYQCLLIFQSSNQCIKWRMIGEWLLIWPLQVPGNAAGLG